MRLAPKFKAGSFELCAKTSETQAALQTIIFDPKSVIVSKIFRPGTN